MSNQWSSMLDAWRRAALVADAARLVIEYASALDQAERESLPISVAWQAVATTWRHAAAEAVAAASAEASDGGPT